MHFLAGRAILTPLHLGKAGSYVFSDRTGHVEKVWTDSRPCIQPDNGQSGERYSTMRWSLLLTVLSALVHNTHIFGIEPLVSWLQAIRYVAPAPAGIDPCRDCGSEARLLWPQGDSSDSSEARLLWPQVEPPCCPLPGLILAGGEGRNSVDTFPASSLNIPPLPTSELSSLGQSSSVQ